MDEAEELRALQPNPYDTAGLWDFLFFGWPGPLVRLGNTKVLEQEDLPDVSKDDDVKTLGRHLSASWQAELRRKGQAPSLTRALFKTHVLGNWFVGAILIAESALRIYQAQILGRLITFLLASQGDPWLMVDSVYNNGYFLCFLLILLGAAVAFAHHHAFFHAWRLGMQLRGALTTIIYDKSIRLSLASMASISVGHIVNLTAQDVESFQICGCFVHFAYTPLLEALAVLYFGIAEIGVSFVAGFACIILLVPLQKVFSAQLHKSKSSTSRHTDERLKVLNQALNGVRLMKISGWEDVFIRIIEEARKREVAALLYTNIMRGLNEAIFFAMPIMIACFTFVTFVRLGGTLSTAKIFIVLTYFNIVQFSMTKFFSMSIAALTECHVAIRRIERLLLLPEVQIQQRQQQQQDYGVALEFDNFSASWTGMASSSSPPQGEDVPILDKKPVNATATEDEGEVLELTSPQAQPSPAIVLQDVHLSVKRGELLVVVGAVGCGKSSMLLAALGELPAQSGSVRVGVEGIAYCAQTPFILSSTLQDNILFNRPMDRERYQRVLQQCALLTDLELFVHGDMTVIGDKGINLSGGQRARVCLARAMYARDLDLFLLDDPLSAVDTHVGALLFDEAICFLVQQGKTVVLATHQVQYLKSPNVSRVAVMDQGRIVACGPYSEVVALEAVGSLLQEASASVSASTHDSADASLDLGDIAVVDTAAAIAVEEEEEEVVMEDETKASTDTRLRRRSSSAAASLDAGKAQLPTSAAKKNNDIAGITAQEDKESGSVGVDTYREYCRSLGGGWIVFYLTAIMAAAQVLSILANYWLSYWSKFSFADQQQDSFINAYVGIVVAAVFVSVLRAVLVFAACIRASHTLHNKLLRSVICTKILFFDSNPIGRILNRFAKDVAFTDDLLPSTLYDCVQCVMMCMGGVLVVCAAVPYIFISLVPLIVFFVRLRAYFINTSREVKRLESLSRSPVFSHLSESLDGVVTIRAYCQVGQFQATNKELLNTNVRGYFVFVAIARWLGFNLDATVIGLLCASTFGAVLAKNYNAGINNAAISVGIMYIIQLTGLFQWAVRQTAEVESLMVSVERILGYSRLEPEGVLHVPGAVDSSWPASGRIEAKGLSASYRSDLPPVLKDVSFVLEPGMRVGIVGRSGCGKSTLVSTLLRLVDITGGSLSIDGVDITTMGLHDLRPKISVIQQTPFLFSGTVRQNLDPWSRYTDAEIWAALDCVCLKVLVGRFDLGLEHAIEEGGQNFSTGERQLMCLARAILQRNKILIMDEATVRSHFSFRYPAPCPLSSYPHILAS